MSSMLLASLLRAGAVAALLLFTVACGSQSDPAAPSDSTSPAPDAAVADQSPPLVDGPSPAPDAAAPDGPVAAEVVPAGEAWLVWESTRIDGNTSHVYKLAVHADGEQGATPVRLTGDDGGRAPMWSPEGRYISFMHPATETTYVMRPDGSDVREVFAGKPLFWIGGGSKELACSKGKEVHRVDPATGKSALMFRHTDFAHFQKNVMQPAGMTHDGRYLVVGTDLYRYGHKGDNGTFTASFAAAIVDLTDKDKVYFFGYGCAPRTPPEGDYVYHVCGDCPTKPDVYRMKLADLMTRASYEPELAHADPDWGHSYMPRIANDNKWLVYAATTGCHDAWSCDYEIFIHRLRSGATTRTRMTFNAANDRAPDLFVGPPITD